MIFAISQSISRKGVIRVDSTRESVHRCHLECGSEDAILDSVRAMAEACDYVDTIDMFASLSNETITHPQRLLEKIRDDFGSSVTVPLWIYRSQTTDEQTVFGRLSNQAALQSIYAECQDIASIILPIQTPLAYSYGSVEGLSTLAQGLDTAVSFRQSINLQQSSSASSSFSSSREWIQRCTNDGRFPICSLEVSIEPLKLHQVLDQLQQLKISGKILGRAPLRNPFLTSASFAISAADKHASDKTIAYERPWTNFLSIRRVHVPSVGRSARHKTDILESLFLECVGSSFRISGANLIDETSTSTDKSDEEDDSGNLGRSEGDLRDNHDDEEDERYVFTHMTRNAAATTATTVTITDAAVTGDEPDIHSKDSDNEYVLISSVGCGRDTGRYIEEQASSWEHIMSGSTHGSGFRLKVLDYLEYEADDIERIQETLLSLSERYAS